MFTDPSVSNIESTLASYLDEFAKLLDIYNQHRLLIWNLSSSLQMRPIKLPEPPSVSVGMPEIFGGGAYSVVRRAVVIGNGFAGAENQCVGLFRALGLSDRQSLYVNLFFKVKNSSTLWLQQSPQEGPLLVVASGRDTITLASSIRRLAPHNVFVVQIQHPRMQLDRFDLVVTPQHDYYSLTPSGQQEIPQFLKRWITPREPPSRNVGLTVGALHQADSVALRVAAARWHDELAPLPKPLLVVNIGGPTCHVKYGTDLAKELAEKLQNVLASCGSVRISFSRRTPLKVSSVISKEIGDHPKVYIWNGEEPNPHMGHLAWADAFIVTADSISMLSEACSTGKPVYVIGSERCKWKFSAFHKVLRERGVVRKFTGKEDKQLREFVKRSPNGDGLCGINDFAPPYFFVPGHTLMCH
ncbi:hypothetical protein QJS10_CPA08g01399 [Acorus calamus]|uniref:Mitochondrial fission protein ELM1 n=1 Tax=Acorus calamus TaxID=4465 RepID=A0AAV9E8N5_ACOCL|nr:hypothetical protein QJS10_CPA08g01399 [Acorus calamus]